MKYVRLQVEGATGAFAAASQGGLLKRPVCLDSWTGGTA